MPALLLVLILLVTGFMSWMYMNACTTHVRYAELYLPDLPQSFEGCRIAYVSDINAMSKRDAAYCAEAVNALQSLNPDLLILGGGYSAPGPADALNGIDAGNTADALCFIEGISGFYAPLGKFAVAGDGDDVQALENAFSASGVRLLSDACAQVEKDGEKIFIAGLSDISQQKTPYEEIGAYFDGNECVIAVAHNPTAYVGVRVAEARGGGAWADLVLSGHTLGGQIRILGRTLRSMTEEENRFLSGWYYSDDLPLLVSSGLGCRDIPLRLGSKSEIWQITLKKPEKVQLPDF